MPFDSKEDLQSVCEAVLTYQHGLEAIEKYIGRLNGYVGELTAKLAQSGLTETVDDYGARLKDLEAGMEEVAKSIHVLRDSKNGIGEQVRMIGRFDHAVKRFEESMAEFNQRADSLSQKLYNKDFNNAIKSMNAIAEESRGSGTYEYRHVTDHDYTILKEEYEGSIAYAENREQVMAFLTAVRDIVLDSRLKHEEYESLQRLVEKMLHSDSKALNNFLNDILKDGGAPPKRPRRPAKPKAKPQAAGLAQDSKTPLPKSVKLRKH